MSKQTAKYKTIKYNPRSEKDLIKLFPTLEPVQCLEGVYESELPGPLFMRPLQSIFLKLTGLPGWGGKQFFKNHAVNIVTRKGVIQAGPKMTLTIGPHLKDGKVGMIATYEKNSPFLWRHCTDEFRYVNDNTILGVSRFDLPGVRHKDVMFMLHKASHKKGVV